MERRPDLAAGLERVREPVEVLLSAYGDECATEPVPFQVIKETRANHTSPTRQPLQRVWTGSGPY